MRPGFIVYQYSIFTSSVATSLVKTSDSLSYYRLLSFYSKSYFVTADFDSILYYNQFIKRFCDRVTPSPEVHDLLSTVYNIEGNVLMQRTQPDSAIISYEKAYKERLQGKEVGLSAGLMHKSG